MILAGGIDETLSARFVVSEMAEISALVGSSGPSGWWDSAFMVEVQGGRKKILRRERYGEDSQRGEGPSVTRRLVQTGHVVKRVVFMAVALNCAEGGRAICDCWSLTIHLV